MILILENSIIFGEVSLVKGKKGNDYSSDIKLTNQFPQTHSIKFDTLKLHIFLCIKAGCHDTCTADNILQHNTSVFIKQPKMKTIPSLSDQFTP